MYLSLVVCDRFRVLQLVSVCLGVVLFTVVVVCVCLSGCRFGVGSVACYVCVYVWCLCRVVSVLFSSLVFVFVCDCVDIVLCMLLCCVCVVLLCLLSVCVLWCLFVLVLVCVVLCCVMLF